MELEKQVVSLELARKLKELGVKQDSHFKWCLRVRRGTTPDEVRAENDNVVNYALADQAGINANKIYVPEFAAFTVAELADWQKDVDEPQPYYANGFWWWYRGEEQIEADTQANAYAARGIHFVENKLLPTQ